MKGIFKNCKSQPSIDRLFHSKSSSKISSSNPELEFTSRLESQLGPFVRLRDLNRLLSHRVLLLHYRYTRIPEKPFLPQILTSLSHLSYPNYKVIKTRNLFPSRFHLLDYELFLNLLNDMEGKGIRGGFTREDATMWESHLLQLDGLSGRWEELVEEGGGEKEIPDAKYFTCQFNRGTFFFYFP